jgi:hypothetical protein
MLAVGCDCVGEDAAAGASPDSTGSGTRWAYGLEAGLREGFDSNVFLQSETELANRSSWVTTMLGQLWGSWTSAPWKVRLGYQPETSFFHSEASEDFVAHRCQLEGGYQQAGTKLDVGGTMTVIDGDSVGLIWSGPGGAPATGGPTVRDRRDSAVYRGSIRLTQDWGTWLVRPVLTGYSHDFRTVQKTTPGYLNSVDRSEITAGLDGGRAVGEGLKAWLGYRYGRQDEARLLDYPEEYDNRFHRVLGGCEGRLAPWLKGSVALGPEFRRYGDRAPASMGDHDVVNVFVDGTLTWTPGTADTVVLAARQFEQPGFAGRSAYEDMTLDLGWRHVVNSHWTVGAGGRAYGTSFLRPVIRHDWVFSLNGLVHYDFSKRYSTELSYAFEEGQTRDSGASAREYDRHWVALGLRAVFH